MKRLLATFAIAGALIVGGCATNPDGTHRPLTISEIAAQAREIIRTSCDFVVNAQVIVDIIRVGEITAPYAIANAVCRAVLAAPQTARGAVAPVTVSGVVIKGRFRRGGG